MFKVFKALKDAGYDVNRAYCIARYSMMIKTGYENPFHLADFSARTPDTSGGHSK